MSASLVALLLAIFALQAFGQVVLREGGAATNDRLSEAMNGPRGLWVRAGLLLLLVLLVLLGTGVLEPATLTEYLLKLTNAA